MLSNSDSLLYSGECKIKVLRGDSRKKECVAVPVLSNIKKFPVKEYRGERYQLNSPLHITFTDPISGTLRQMRIKDLSGSGFSIIEKEKQSVLFAGLIIPEIRIQLPGKTEITCRAQVIYNTAASELNQGFLKSGLAILDMDPMDYSWLLNFIHHEIDDRAYVCNDVDMKSLWSFFFESGFIYPEKYKYIFANKEKIKKLYEKLYSEHPGIARHFIYQEENHIQGHMSMLRSYENSWLLHHHAASTIHGHNGGLQVLNQIGSFGNNCHRIESMHFEYLMCYFRRENKFPDKVFGGLAKKINNPKHCSLDDWAYFYFNKINQSQTKDISGWELRKTTEGELKNLECYYENNSGGLLFKAFNLDGDDSGERSLINDYEKSGLLRDISLFSIQKDNQVKGMIMVDCSEAGINMSDLTNSFKIFITDPEGLTKEILNTLLIKLSNFYPDEDRISALLYPHNLADELNISIEKIYTLWVLNMEASDTYFHYLKLLLRIIKH
ncbi:MAG: hypothetical protein PF518_06745 [Spirochaetaceae bacterium]|nr:hypothetical protein [Spirochaetaceae bacterium]